jgi:hypothetical protein
LQVELQVQDVQVGGAGGEPLADEPLRDALLEPRRQVP